MDIVSVSQSRPGLQFFDAQPHTVACVTLLDPPTSQCVHPYTLHPALYQSHERIKDRATWLRRFKSRFGGMQGECLQ